MLERAGIPRENILAAYIRRMPNISSTTVKQTHYRLLDVQIAYLEEILNGFEEKENLDISQREVLMSMHSLSKHLKSHMSSMIADNRDVVTRLTDESAKVHDRIAELLRKNNQLSMALKDRPKSLLGGGRNSALNLGRFRSSPV